MDDLVAHVEARITSHRLLRNGQGVVVAVSGGVDSVVLFEVLRRLAVRHRWRLVVAHFNHGLRGRASDADERFVRRLARRQGLPCVVGRGDVRRHARQHGLSVEMAARELRHRFLAAVARARGLSTIALAHHADDKTELFFLRLLRGSGSEGLAGMRWRGPSPAAEARVQLIRPLLDVPRRALFEFARQEGLTWREDASNRDLTIPRNRLRHQVLPRLRRWFQPALETTVQRLCEMLGDEAEYLAACAARWQRRPGGVPFDHLPSALQRHVLRAQARQLGVEADFDLIERLRLNPDTVIPLCPAQGCLRSATGRLRLVSLQKPEFRADRRRVLLRGAAGRLEFGGLEVTWRIRALRGARRPPPETGREWLDADKVGHEILLRHWQPGDRFQPCGFDRPAKLQDLLTNAKIPAAHRRDLVLAVTRNGEIFWVEGLRPGAQCLLTPQTRRRLEWRWRRRLPVVATA